MLKIHNTLTKKDEVFKPIKKGSVSLYTCGPTVYDYAHIGNFRAMIFYDVVRRYLEYSGYKVKHIMNITDVDDKIIKGCKKENKSLKKFTNFYLKAFVDDLRALNIEQPYAMPLATEHIKEMIYMIKKLKKNGFTYEKNNTIYFNISKFKNYGKLANIDPEHLKENAEGRLNEEDEYEKENIRDFALWKAHSKEDGSIFWETELGKGRPGWHIECSAMAVKYLGETFDMHLGGEDLMFPHHTNEIAQSEGATGKKFVNYWMHNAHLLVDGKKMSKSLGNFYTLRDLLEKGSKPTAIRYLLLSAHYRIPLNFTEESLKAAEASVQRINDFVFALRHYKDGGKDDFDAEKYRKEFENAMDNDFNVSEALAVIFEMIKDVNTAMAGKKISSKAAKKVLDLLLGFDKVLGVVKEEEKIPKNIIDLAEEREEARQKKDWKGADKLRDEIKKKGYIIEDTKDGYVLKKA